MAEQAMTPVEIDFNGAEMASDTTQYTTLTTDGGYFVNDGNTLLHIINTAAGGSTNIVIDSPATCDQGGTHDITVAVPDDDDYIIGPFPKHRFNDSDGYVHFTVSEATNVTGCAFKLTQG